MDLQVLHPKFVTDENGNKTEVILPINIFNQIIEDLEDLSIVASRRNESSIKHEDLINDLKANGYI